MAALVMPPEVIRLRKWLKENGCATKTFDLWDFPTTGRGMKAKEQIEAGNVLISIPSNLLVTRKKAQQNLPRQYSTCSTHEVLTLFIIEEKKKGPSSFWAPYIETLPKSYDVPFFAAEDEISCLPDFLESLVRKQLFLVEWKYRRLVKLKALSNSVSKQDFATAWFAVNTRSVFVPGDKDPNSENMALAPYLDMFNHSWDARVEIVLRDGSYRLITNKKISRRKQAFINYGSHDNMKLYLEYGFVLPDNPNDLIPISHQDLLSCVEGNTGQLISSKEEKQKILEENGYSANMGFTQSGFTWNTLASMYVFKLEANLSWTTVLNVDLTNILEEEKNVLREMLLTKIEASMKNLKAKTELTPSSKCAYQVLKYQLAMLKSNKESNYLS